jgi:hypothetical protein
MYLRSFTVLSVPRPQTKPGRFLVEILSKQHWKRMFGAPFLASFARKPALSEVEDFKLSAAAGLLS